ncbi:zinc transporter ZntB [uncultured Desulfuromonas sp.]|uniref:zinc transporter ZntB n=1 Tax=uncultured Desulfuromonas sp. TaxID=181013 RepID=UPI002AAAFE32|nr:zinc transporter ZntB [uncultured Desulfuromonas sp.]
MSINEKPQGFHFARHLDGNGGAEVLDWPLLQNGRSRDQVWVHCDYEDPQIQQWLTRQSLDPLVVEAMTAEDSRPRVALFDQGALVGLRGVNKNPDEAMEDMVSLRVWLDPDRIITLSNKPLASIRDIQQQFVQGRGPKTTQGLFSELCDRLEWYVSQMIDDYEDEVELIEQSDLAEDHLRRREAISNLRRRVVTPRRYLAPQRDALSHLSVEPPSWFNERTLMHLKEIRNRLQRHMEDLDAVRDRTVIVQEELQAQVSDQLNARMYIINIFAAIFLPLSFFTGLFGVNLGGIPGAHSAVAFLLFSFCLLVIGVGLMVVFHWKRWF